MKNNDIHTTSSLRQKRNILGTFSRQLPDCHEQPEEHNTGIGSLIVLFMESLVERGIEPGVIVGFCTELRPFFAYIEDVCCITAIADLECSHVEGYAAAVRTGYEAGERSFTDALDANGLLSVVRLFCLYLQSTGMIAEDYGLSFSTIPYPKQQLSATGKE